MNATISEIIELLEEYQENEGDMEIWIYNSSGERINPKSLQTGCVMRGGGTEEYAYFSDL